MKDINIRYACASICVALVSAMFVGCSRFEEEDLFDESASQRITHFNEQLQSRLVTQSSEGKYGWVIQYFVAGTDESDYEGFNLFGSFSGNGKVKIAGNHRFLRDGNAGKYTEYTSVYDVLSEDGPVLAFNTWNDVLTVFVDPVDPSYAPSTLVNDGEGLHGDQNLVFQGYKGDTIMFSGERNSARIRFVPCDRPWQDYIADTEALKNKITNSSITSYYVVCGTDTLYFKDLRSGIITYCERINDPLSPSIINCVFTPNGFYLQHRNKIGGTSFQEFTLTPDNTCLMSENDSVQVYATWDNYIINHTAVWEMDTELFTEEQQTLFDQIAEGVTALNKQWSLKSIGMGRSTGKNPVNGLILTYYTNTAKTKTNNAGLELALSKPQSKQLSIDCTEDNVVDNNLSVFTARGSAVEALLRQFAATLVGTYDMTPNDYFLPTSVHCTPISSGTAFTIGN